MEAKTVCNLPKTITSTRGSETDRKIKRKVRKPGIEPGAQRWQRWILPLNHLRLLLYDNCEQPIGLVYAISLQEKLSFSFSTSTVNAWLVTHQGNVGVGKVLV